MVRIDALRHRLGEYQKNQCIKSAGSALQEWTATCLHPDGRILGELAAGYKTLEAVSGVTFHLHIPQIIGTNQFKVNINGTHFEFSVADAGLSLLECEYFCVADQPVHIHLTCSRMVSPYDVDGSGDKVEFETVLESARFQSDEI